MRRKVLLVISVWALVAIGVLVLYVLWEHAPVKEFLEWVLGIWPVLAALGASALALSAWIIKHDFAHGTPIYEPSVPVTEGQDNTPKSPVDYTIEWEHYDKLKEAIIGLPSASSEQAKILSNVIQRERVYLDDAQLQDAIDKFMVVVDECLYVGIPVDTLLVNMIIGATANV